MSLQNDIMEGIKTAMKAKDTVTLESLRAVKSALLLAQTESGASGELSQEDEIKLLQKLVKQRKDSLEIFQQQNREDLALKEQEEIAVIEKFLPRQLDENELKDIISGIITTSGATSPADMGKVMGLATKQLAGKADGKTVSAIVRQLLAK